MRGGVELLAARMSGAPICRLEIDVVPEYGSLPYEWARPGLENRAGRLVARVEVSDVDDIARVDLRAAKGLPTSIHTYDWARGWALVEHLIACECLPIAVHAPDGAAFVDADGEVASWDL